MKFKVPYIILDKIMTYGRQQGYVNSISGVINSDGSISDLRYSTTNVRRVKPEHIKKFELIDVKDYKEISIEVPYKIGQEVLHFNDNNLKIGTITNIEFTIANSYKIFYYRIGYRGVDSYNIYTDKQDFINRTKPKKELLDNQRYIFTQYCIQQNNLVPVTVEKLNDVSYMITDGYDRGEKKRGTNLYTESKKFYNKMFSEL